MAYPIILPTGAFVADIYDFGSEIRPGMHNIAFEYLGNQYAFLAKTTDPNAPTGTLTIQALKSTDVGQTWVAQNTGSAPLLATFPPAGFPRTASGHSCVWRDGSTVRILGIISTENSSNPPWSLDGFRIWAYDLATDTWSTSTDFMSVVPGFINGAGFQNIGAGNGPGLVFVQVVVRGPSDYVVVYNGPVDTISGSTYGRIYVVTFNGTTFGTPAKIPSQTGNAFLFAGVGAVVDANGINHIIYLDDTDPAEVVCGPQLHHISYMPDGSFGTPQLMDKGMVFGFNGNGWSVSPPILFLIGATTYVGFIAYVNDQDDCSRVTVSIRLYYAPAVENPVWSSIIVTQGTEDTGASCPLTTDNALLVPQNFSGGASQYAWLSYSTATSKLYAMWCTTDPSFLGHWEFSQADPNVLTWSAPVSLFDAPASLTGTEPLGPFNPTTDNAACSLLAYPMTSGSLGFGVLGDCISCNNVDHEVTLFFTENEAPPPGPTCTLNAAPTTIDLPGDPVTLTWTTTNTPTTAVIDQGVGSVNPAGGSTVVFPPGSVTYTLTVTSAGGTSICQASVVVTCASAACALTPALVSTAQPCELEGS